ncbi:MAG: tape measure protein [Aeromonas veronii]
MANNIRTALIVDLEGNLSERAARYTRSMSTLASTGVRSLSKLGEGAKAASAGIDSWGNRALVVSGAAAYGFNRTFVNTTATFERFESVLRVVEGSSEKARASMDWVTGFASTTPYELAEVTDAFVKLKAYGIDPQSGALKAAGDAAAALGKPLTQAVEAMADAMTGENERLKEFGITSETRGNKIRYSWQQNGKTMTAVVNKNSKEQIQSTLMSIWNGRYAGAMDERSKTWEGMVSNMGDSWTVFQKDVMEKSGAFNLLKGQLGDLLGQLDKMKETGEYDALVQTVGTNLVDAFKGVGDAVQDIQAFGEGVVDVYTRVASLMDEVAKFTGMKADPAATNDLDQMPQEMGTREMTTAVLEFVAGVYVLNKTVRVLAPLLKGGATAGGWLLRRNKVDANTPSMPAPGRGLSGIKLPLPVYVVNDRMSLMPDQMGGQPDLPGKEQTPKKTKAGKVAIGAEKLLTGARNASRKVVKAPKTAGLAAVAIDGLTLMPTLLSDDVSREEKIQATAETAGGAAGAWAGAAAGAALGSFIPIVGTALGGMLGGLVGYVGGQWAGEKAAEQINQSLDVTVKLEGTPGTKAEVTQMKSSTDNLNSSVYYGAGMR